MKPPGNADVVSTSIHVDGDALADLRTRLAKARWPDELPGGWAVGADASFMRSLVGRWRTGFDWRAQERELNAFRNFMATVDGVPVHFIHEVGEGGRPMPLLIGHGWPGSIFELLEIIPMLTHPSRYGGDPDDAFTVVAASLPGHGFSYRPGQPLMGVSGMADTLSGLMTKALGYERYGVHGHDWSAFVAARLGQVRPEELIGLHVTLLAHPRDPADIDRRDPEQVRYSEQLARWLAEESGYIAIMATKPMTLSYALSDSPLGLAAWIAEKFVGWSEGGTGFADRIVDRLLANVTTYWATGSTGATFWPYHIRRREPWLLVEDEPVLAPMGYAAHPSEFIRPPRAVAQRFYRDIRRWTEMPAGGHFPALEAPGALAREIRAFFRPLRQGIGVAE